VQTRRWDPDEGVALAYAVRPKYFLAVDDANEKSGEVVGVRRVHAWHLRGLAA